MNTEVESLKRDQEVEVLKKNKMISTLREQLKDATNDAKKHVHHVHYLEQQVSNLENVNKVCYTSNIGDLICEFSF